MGTSSTSNLNSSSSSSAIFNGNSRYSSDFQAVISRTTAIASLPITDLQNQKTNLGDESTALTSLGGVFTKLQSAIDGVNQSLSGSSYSAQVSDPSIASVTLGDGAMEGSYGIEVVDKGSYATSMSSSAWTTDAGPVHNFQLSVGGKTFNLTPTDNSAASVAKAINSQYSDKVRATVVNVGSSSAPDYRISLQATTLGDLQPDLLDSSTSLQNQQTTGVLAHYIVNNSGKDVYSASRSVTIATGITVNLQGKAPGNPVDITVTRSSSAVSDALQNFATAYNAAVDEVGKEFGQNAGVLSGQSVVGQLSQILSGIATYTSPGSQVSSLANLGLSLDSSNNGHLNFSPLQFIGADIGGSSAVTAFLGNSTDGGFLKFATNAMNGAGDSTSGLIATVQNSVKTEITEIDSHIADQQAIVDQMQQQLTARMAASDALIASMEQQYSFLFGMFQAQQVADQQFK